MLRCQAPPFIVGNDAALRDTQQRVMRLVKIAVGEIGVVGRDQWQIVRIGEIDEPGLAARFFHEAVTLQFDIKPAREDVLEHRQRSFGRLGLAFREQTPDRARRATGEADQPIARGGEIGKRDRRLGAGLAIEKGAAHKSHQIAVAGLALDE